jgi:integrase
MTLADLIDRWLAFRAQLAGLDGIAPSTEAKQRQTANSLSRMIGETSLSELSPSAILLWSKARTKEVAATTHDGEMRLLKQILNWAVDEAIIAQRPKLPTVKVANVEAPLPSDEDYVWYLRTLAPRHAEALEFMLLTGLAPHELARLQPRDMTHDGLFIGAREDFRVKAEARRREVPLNRRAAMIWSRWSLGLAPDIPVFPTEAAMQKAMKRRGCPPGSEGVTPKMMRKWFASMVAAENSEAILQRLLGHVPGSPVTRRHYVRSQDEALRGAVAGLGIDSGPN